MRFMVTALSACTLLACAQGDVARVPTAPELPNAPLQPTSSLTWMWGMAVDESGMCIVDATATVVRGQGLGRSMQQTTPCAAWDYDGGFIFNDLTPGVEMTVRVSASGYTLLEKTVVPSSGPQSIVQFTLTRIR